MHYEMLSCPNCKHPLDVHLLGISSGLGPPRVVCRCGTPITTERKEWAALRRFERLKFVGVSLAYVLVTAFFGAVSAASAARFLAQGPGDTVNVRGPGSFEGMLVTGLLVAGLQGLRIRLSKKRSPEGQVVPFRAAMGNLALGLQVKVAIRIFALPLSALLVSLLLERR
jgi:hypothetical protein